MSTELFDYIQAVKPSLSDEKRGKIGMLPTSYVALASLHWLCPNGRRPDLVWRLFRTQDVTCAHDNILVLQELRLFRHKYHIDVEACIRRNKLPKAAASCRISSGPHRHDNTHLGKRADITTWA
ncbi:unnamed protein product [Rhizoctonia solani]|uniref:Uncharacterized protein n=1 Tax=Rhizoctonia solani TaxID=456999 RepID=A0A8H3BQ28_9AGAM|nr:unnamed protein product [Rhizoctonia solani]